MDNCERGALKGVNEENIHSPLSTLNYPLSIIHYPFPLLPWALDDSTFSQVP